MRGRRLIWSAAFGCVVALTGSPAGAGEAARTASVPAQNAPTPQLRPDLPQPPKDLRGPTRLDQERGLDFLLGALKAAPDESSARHVEHRIWALWSATRSDTTQLLMARANVAIAAKQYDLALQLLDSVVRLSPDYLEGWNRRASVYYLQDRYTEALADLQQVLSREPRHFGALGGLGYIMREIGDERRALIALRRALEIDPHLDKVPELVRRLQEKVEGRDI